VRPRKHSRLFTMTKLIMVFDHHDTEDSDRRFIPGSYRTSAGRAGAVSVPQFTSRDRAVAVRSR